MDRSSEELRGRTSMIELLFAVACNNFEMNSGSRSMAEIVAFVD